MDRIYLDNAATSWPKPEAVYAAVDHHQRTIGAPAGRGAYREAVESQRVVEQTRGLVANLIGAENRRNIAFTCSCTDSLSTSLFGLLKPGDHVVTTTAEHNSVLRPLRHLESTGIIEVTYVGCDPAGFVSADDLIAAIRADTRLVCMIHVSNVTGTIEPVANIKRRMLESGNDQTLLLIDAAQSLGHIPVDVQHWGCDILTASGHKGLLGPLGTGILYVADEIAAAVSPFRYGGTGTDGSVDVQPTKVPDKFESGNLNVPGIAGIRAGINFLQSRHGNELQEIHQELILQMLEGLLNLDQIRIFGPTTKHRAGVFSISINGLDPHDAASILDANWSIQTRAGLHCAPRIHDALGTRQLGGTIRLSLGLFNTTEHVKLALEAIEMLAST